MSPKPKQTAHFVTFTGHFRTFRLGDGGRAAWSVKGAQQFWMNGKLPLSTKFLRVPCRQTFDRLRLALPFLGVPKGTNVPKVYRSRWGFVSVQFGYRQETVKLPCLLFPAVKVYDENKNYRRKNHQ